ncbi:VOC family protein [Paracoccus sp. EGI L200073]|nr:VOC family protein [Paracoccus salsus]
MAERLGVAPQPGGRHPLMGTHNRLLSLGPGEYLELIAIDPGAAAPAHPRWFGLDRFHGPPRIAGWVMRQSPLVAPAGTTVAEASRGDLRWRITIPDAGQMPGDGAVPMRIDWENGAHPGQSLPDHGLRLARLDLPLGRMPCADPRLGPGPFAVHVLTPGGIVAL